MRQIAQLTGGSYYTAANGAQLVCRENACNVNDLHVEALAVTDDRSAHSGTVAWTYSYNPPQIGNGWPFFQTPNFYSLGNALAVTPDNVVVAATGQTDPQVCPDPSYSLCGDGLVIDLDPSTGAPRWHDLVRDPIAGPDPFGWFHPYSLVASPESNLAFVTGNSRWAATTVAFDLATGRQVWSDRYQNPVYGWECVGMGLALSRDGNSLYVAGNFGGGQFIYFQF